MIWNMKNLKRVQVEPSKMETLNNIISNEIIAVLGKDDGGFIEGIVATGAEFGSVPGMGVNLLFLYNEYTPTKIEPKYIENEDIEMYVHTESADLWNLEDEKERRTMRGNYSYEQEVKYGTLLYDRNGNVEKLRKKLLEEETYDINYWRGMCEFEPPVQYKKRAKM